MQHFSYRQGELYCENVPAADIADRHGTPTIVYSAAALRAGLTRFTDAFTPLGVNVSFALRACPNVACLRVLAEAGATLTAASGTELERAWLAGAPFTETIFAGVGKADMDIRASLDGLYSPLFQAGATLNGRPPYYRGPVGRLVAESEDELERIARLTDALAISCRVALRVDPELEDFDIAQSSNAPTGKFALPPSLVPSLFDRYAENPRVRLTGLHMHLGPGVVLPDRFARAAATLGDLARQLTKAGHRIDFLDFGGGFPTNQPAREAQGPHAAEPADYAAALTPIAAEWAEREHRDDQLPRRLYIEPGRAIAAPAAHLLVGVRDVKFTEDRAIVITDAGVSPGRRPPSKEGLVIAWPARVPPHLEPPAPGDERLDTRGLRWTDVVGPSHATGDAIAEGRLMPPVETGHVIGVSNAGGYARDTLAPLADHPTPAEILVEGFQSKVIRPRPSAADLIRPEPHALHHTKGSKRD
ncbi:MAG: hypothetical protein AAF297_01430 [Planctomycetota bacterium]